jgi:hypothetical protein
MTGPAYVTLEAGDTAPHFSQTSLSGDFNLSNLGGGLTVLAIFMSSAGGVGQAVLEDNRASWTDLNLAPPARHITQL